MFEMNPFPHPDFCCGHRPLCRRYVLVVFDHVVMRWQDQGEPREAPVCWALGWLTNGDSEPLDAWLDPDPAGLARELRGRGVERIWRLTGTASASIREHLTRAFHISGAPHPVGATAVATAEAIRIKMERAIRRRGRFDSAASGLEHVERWLEREQRLLYQPKPHSR